MSMDKRKYGPYYLGLDIGTDSIGWAVTDLSYQIMRFGKKAMWGVRLFEPAKTAAERRAFRIARRRIQRRAQRLALLQDVFAQAIDAVDPGFLMRLRESALHEEDKTEKDRNTLFADGAYTDKEYHRAYPTIYHLRKALMESDQPHDVRLVYLAIHHILKYRGHFLFEGDLKSENSLEEIVSEWTRELWDACGVELKCDDTQALEEILTNRDLRMQQKQKALFERFQAKDSREKAFLKLLTGATVKLTDLFDLPEGEKTEVVKVDFTSEEYGNQSALLEALLGDRFYVLEKLKALYDWALLADTLQGEQYLSCAKVDTYEQHGKDLRCLKRVIRRYTPQEYKRVFSAEDEKANYSAYIGMTKKNGRKLALTNKKCTQEEFGAFVKGILKGVKTEDPELSYILNRIELGRFMPKATSKDNGVIPNQLHRMELTRILENAQKYLPFLSTPDENGLTAAEKIEQILTFRIPYYVGPLNNRNPKAENCWVVRRSQEKIYPWNFDQIVDREASAAAFITRMTAQCTYLPDEKVLPQSSVLYSRFAVLNEINAIKIKGEPISVELKQAIYTELFLKNKQIKRKRIAKFLCSRGMETTDADITGVDEQLHASMRSMMEMKELLGERYSDETADQLIRLITIFGDDRDMLRRRIERECGHALTQEQIEAACKKRYTGWGRFSRAFLTEIVDVSPETGECRNIMTMLWETNNNLMQLLSREFTFTEAIRARNRRDGQEEGLVYGMVRDLYVSPAVKRQIWQSLSVVKELLGVMGHAPEKIFVEMARGEEEKKRTESRKSKLMALYKKCKDETRDWMAELGRRDESDFRRDRLYLYYTQMGKCMYTGEPIDVSQIFDENIYDVDHIYPRSLVKDDSLDNRVLVKRVVNANKSDVYPLDESIRQQQNSYWRMLLDKELITKRKFARLTRSTPLSGEELAEFIARQLVETRQSTKAVADILGRVVDEKRIVYVKAGLVSEFRQNMKMLKCREVNDLHHAKDAYLNVVVGNVYDTRFTRDPRRFFMQQVPKYNLKRLYEFDVERGGVTAWRAGESGSIAMVKKTMSRNNVLFTRMAFEQRGALFDVQPVKKGKWQLPLSADPRVNNPEKYGGYNKITGAHFMLVEHEVKGKRERSIVDIPLHLAEPVRRSPDRLRRLLEEEKELIAPRVILPEIKFDALLEVDGFKMHLTGRGGSQLVLAPAHQLLIGYEWECYVRRIVKFNARAKEYAKFHKGETMKANAFDGLEREKNEELYRLFIEKLEKTAYAVRLSAQAKNLREKEDTFRALGLEAQAAVLEEILHLFACNRMTADLKMLGLGGQTGVIQINRTVSKYESAKIIHQSVTGLFEREVDLLR